MYERSYGARYDEPGKYARVADIAKLIRRDIKEAIGRGDLPGRASNYSVRSESFSGGSAIRVKAIGLDGLYQQCEGFVPASEDGYGRRACGDPWCKAGGRHADLPHARYHDILSVEGRRVEGILKSIHSAYNHDGSDVMTDYFDVRYYGGVDIERPDEAAYRLRRKAG
jgi:hypothetical protein